MIISLKEKYVNIHSLLEAFFRVCWIICSPVYKFQIFPTVVWETKKIWSDFDWFAFDVYLVQLLRSALIWFSFMYKCHFGLKLFVNPLNND